MSESPDAPEPAQTYTLDTLPPRALFVFGALARLGLRTFEDLSDWLERLPPRPDDVEDQRAIEILLELGAVAPEERPARGEPAGEEQDDDADEPDMATAKLVVRLSDEQRDRLLARFDADREARRLALVRYITERLKIDERSSLGLGLLSLDRIHCFPRGRELLADVDSPVRIHPGMTESALHAVVMTVQAVTPKPGDHVLICGAKGGYLAALVAWMVGEKGRVTCIDWQAEVAKYARNSLERFREIAGRWKVELREDVTVGLAGDIPWNVTIVNGALPKIPYELLRQLNDENGRLLFYLAGGGDGDVCYVIRKNEEIVREERLSRFKFTPIPGRYGYDTMRDLQAQYEATKRSERMRPDLTALQQKMPYPSRGPSSPP